MKPLGDFTSLSVHFLDETTEVQTGVPCQRAERHVTTTIIELLIPPAGEGPPELEKVALCSLFHQLSVGQEPRGSSLQPLGTDPAPARGGSPNTSLGSGPDCGEGGSKAIYSWTHSFSGSSLMLSNAGSLKICSP